LIHPRISPSPFCLRDLGFQFLRVDARKFHELLIKRTVIVILATFSREFSAAFVEEAREQGITAEAAPWAARWTLRKIHMRFLRFRVLSK
jgi:hypothetical protein